MADPIRERSLEEAAVAGGLRRDGLPSGYVGEIAIMRFEMARNLDGVLGP